MDESGSGSGSGSGSQSDSGSTYLGSGDLEKGILDSGLEKEAEFDDKKGDGVTLEDDEDFKELAVAGGVNRQRKRSLVRLPGIQQERYGNHKANRHHFLTVGERSRNENAGDVVPMHIEDHGTSDSNFLVLEYEDRYDGRADLLKFER